MQLVRDIDRLRAMRGALIAADAMTRLPKLRHGAVITHQIGAACLGIIGRLNVFGDHTLIDALVVMQQD